jgi:hypothetical protein
MRSHADDVPELAQLVAASWRWFRNRARLRSRIPGSAYCGRWEYSLK